MKTKYKIGTLLKGFIILWMFLSAAGANATHIVGGSMYYKYKGGNKYQIVLELRRDCDSLLNAPFDTIASIGVYYTNGQRVNTLPGILNGQVLIPLSKADTLNEFIESNCEVRGRQVCVHTTTYLVELELPNPLNGLGYTFVYQRCCRNAKLLNIIEPLETGATYWVQIMPQALALQTSSPNFNKWPNIYSCMNSSIEFDHSAEWAEGDSLIYELFTPFSGATISNPRPSPGPPPPYNPIFWKAPYSGSDLLGGTEPLIIDRHTGIITAKTPGIEGQFLVGVCVKQFRNGVWLSTVRRDFQVNLRECIQPPIPQIESITNNCGSRTVSFTRKDSADLYYWNFNDPDSIFILKDSQKVEYTFSKEGTYKVQLKAQRGVDACSRVITREVKVLKNNIKPDFSHLLLGCKEGIDTLTIDFEDQSTITGSLDSIVSRQWTVIQDGDTLYNGNDKKFSLQFFTNDTAFVQLKINSAAGCDTIVFDTLAIQDFVPDADFIYELAACDNDSLSVRLINTSRPVYPNGEIVSSVWTVNGNSYSNDTLVFNFPVQPDTVQVSLRTSFSDLCDASISKNIILSDLVPFPDFDFELAGCATDSTVNVRFIDNTAAVNDPNNPLSLYWISNGISYLGDSVIIEFPNTIDSFSVTLFASFGLNCTREITKKVVPGNLIPKAAFFNKPVLCPDTDSVTVAMLFDESFSLGIQADSVFWHVIYGNENLKFSGDSVAFTILKDQVIQVKLLAKFVNGCLDTVSRELKFGPFPVIDIIASNIILCSGDQDTVFTNGNPAWEYTWTPTDGLDLTDPVNPVLTAGNVNSTYFVTVSDGVCEAVDSVQLIILDGGVELFITGDTLSCDGSVALLVSGGVGQGEYEWATDSTFATVIGMGENLITTFEGDSITYFVRFANDSCATDIKFETVRRAADADFIFQLSNCDTDSIVSVRFINTTQPLSPSDTLTGLEWHALGNIYTGDSVIIDFPNSLDTFPVTLYASFGPKCTRNVTKNVIPGSLIPKVDIVPTLVLCPGDTAKLFTNGNPAWIYTWNPLNGIDLTDPTSPVIIAGTNNVTYYVTVSDGICEAVDSVQILILEGGLDIKILGDSISCDSIVNLTATGGQGPGMYEWSTSSTFSTIIGTSNILIDTFSGKTITYYVRFKGGKCFSLPDSITVINAKPVIDDSFPYILCPGDMSEVVLINEVPTDILIYNWLPDPHIVSGSNTNKPKISIGENESGSVVLYYTVTNQYNCELKDSVLINIGENGSISVRDSLTGCGDLEMCFSVSGGFTGFISWDFGDPNTSGDMALGPEACYTYPAFGSYTVTVKNLTTICPFKPDTIVITLYPDIDVQGPDDDLICQGEQISLQAMSNIPGTTFTWKDQNGNMVGSGDVFTTRLDSSSWFLVEGEDFRGCVDSDTVRVQVFEFNYNINVKDSICYKMSDNINLQIDNPSEYTFQWSPDVFIVSGGTGTNPLVNLDNDQEFTVVITHKETGCVDTGRVFVKVTKPFSFTVESSVLCPDVQDTLQLTIANPSAYRYLWSPSGDVVSGGTTTQPVIVLSGDKILNVKVTEISSGCEQQLDIPIDVADPFTLSLDADPDTELYEGKSVRIFVVDPVSGFGYDWSTNEAGVTEITVSPVDDTEYCVTATDQYGCEQIECIDVTVRKARCDESDIFIPNAFSPNGDGVNDIFRVRSNFIDELLLIVYNRWGQEVFRTTDINGGWDGTFKGEELPSDAYAYYVKVICVNTLDYSKRGNVNLIR